MQFELAGESTCFVVIAAESSDTASGNFFDVEERITGQNNLKTRCGKRFRVKFWC